MRSPLTETVGLSTSHVQTLFIEWAPLGLLGLAAYVPGAWPFPLGNAVVAGFIVWSVAVLQSRPSWAFPIGVVPLALMAAGGLAGLGWSQNVGMTIRTLIHAGGAAILLLAALQPRAVRWNIFHSGLAFLGALRCAELLVYAGLSRAGVSIPFWGTPNLNFAGLTVAVGAVASLVWLDGTRRRTRMVGLFIGISLAVLLRFNLMGSFLAGIVGIGTWGFGRFRRRDALVLIPFVLMVALGLFVYGPAWIRNNPGDPARLERLAIWSDTVRMVAAHPFGAGLGTFETFYRAFQSIPGERVAPHAHNEYLELLFELGIPLGLAALGWIVLVLQQCMRDMGPVKRTSATATDAEGTGLNRPVHAGLLTTLLAAAAIDFPFRGYFPLLALSFSLAPFALGKTQQLGRGTRRAFAGVFSLFALFHVAEGLTWEIHRAGKQRLEQSRHAEALRCFETASLLWPWEPHLVYDQADCLVRLNQTEEAARRLIQSLNQTPRDIANRRALAKLTLRHHGAAAAAEVYAPILHYAPFFTPYWREMGDLLQWAGDAQAADAHYQKALSLERSQK